MVVHPINQHRNDQGDGEHLVNEMRFLDEDSHFKYCRMTVNVTNCLLDLQYKKCRQILENLFALAQGYT